MNNNFYHKRKHKEINVINLIEMCYFNCSCHPYCLHTRAEKKEKEKKKKDQHQVLKGAKTRVTSNLVLLVMLSHSFLFFPLFLYILCSVKRKWWCLTIAKAWAESIGQSRKALVKMRFSMNNIFTERCQRGRAILV